jgi:hypothetical protein
MDHLPVSRYSRRRYKENRLIEFSFAISVFFNARLKACAVSDIQVHVDDTACDKQINFTGLQTLVFKKVSVESIR